MEIRELSEKRFAVDALFVNEPEVRIVAEDNDLLALRGDGLYSGNNLLRVGKRRRVAGRVVGEIENQNLLLAGGEKCLLHRVRVKRAFLEGIEELYLAADGFLEDQLVVVPEEVGADERVARPCKELRADADAVGERVRHDGIGKRLALERGILDELHRAPRLAQFRQAEAARIEERSLVEVNRLPEAVHHERRAVLLECHADRRVDCAGLRLRTLPENSTVWKIHAPTGRGEKISRRAERLVQLKRQLVHIGRILYQKGADAETAVSTSGFPSAKRARVTSRERSRRRRSPST